jgi:prepilin-type N-terminal cleavage/methylation domain-containing protein
MTKTFPRNIRRDDRRGFTIVELMTVVSLIGILTALAVPSVDVSRHRADAAANQVRSILQHAHRTAVSQQHEVIVSFDTVTRRVRVIEDRNNDRRLQPTDRTRWVALEDGIRFAVPPIRVRGGTASSAIVGSTTTNVDALPSIIFRRDGSAHAEAELYLESTGRKIHRRAVSLTKSIGRASWFHLPYGTTTWREASL